MIEPRNQTVWYLSACARNGDLNGVREHLAQSPQCEWDKALVGAASAGYQDIVQYLVEQGADPNYLDGAALTNAAAEGHVEIVALLLPVSDLQTNNGNALASAAFRGKVTCLEFLLTYVDARTNNHQALIDALKGLGVFNDINNQKCIDLLLPKSDVAAVLKTFESTPPMWVVYKELWADIIAQQQASVLNAVVGTAQLHANRKI